MRRRDVFRGAGLLAASTTAGCVGNLDSLIDSRRERERVRFERIESEYVIAIRNGLNESVEGEVSVTDANEVVEERRLSVDAEDTTSVTGPFETGSEPYAVSVSANGDTTETVLEPSGSPYDRFTYTVSSDGISFREGYRPSADVVISNRLDERVDVRVEAGNRSNGSRIYDTVTVSPDEVGSFRGVFADEARYDVTVEADGTTKSITHRNSHTNGVSVTVERDELRVVVSER